MLFWTSRAKRSCFVWKGRQSIELPEIALLDRFVIVIYLGARFSEVPKTFRARKAIRKLRPAHSVKLVFSYVVKGLKIKISAKFRASRPIRFEDAKRIMSP